MSIKNLILKFATSVYVISSKLYYTNVGYDAKLVKCDLKVVRKFNSPIISLA